MIIVWRINLIKIQLYLLTVQDLKFYWGLASACLLAYLPEYYWVHLWAYLCGLIFGLLLGLGCTYLALTQIANTQ